MSNTGDFVPSSDEKPHGVAGFDLASADSPEVTIEVLPRTGNPLDLRSNR